MNKRSFAFIVAMYLILSNVFASSASYMGGLDIPTVDKSKKVYDFANLFSSDEEELLYNKITEFINNCTFDMAIVTINDNPVNSAKLYADDFYDNNHFGSGDTHDGILFLIDMDTRTIWISTSGNSRSVYDDRVEDILDSVYDNIVNGEYYECAVTFVDEAKYYYDLGSTNEYSDFDETDGYIVVFVVAFVISIIVVLVMKSKHKTVQKATNATNYLMNKSITYREDTFMSSYTSKDYIPPPDTSSGGSSGGGHGGGGRSF